MITCCHTIVNTFVSHKTHPTCEIVTRVNQEKTVGGTPGTQ